MGSLSYHTLLKTRAQVDWSSCTTHGLVMVAVADRANKRRAPVYPKIETGGVASSLSYVRLVLPVCKRETTQGTLEIELCNYKKEQWGGYPSHLSEAVAMRFRPSRLPMAKV